LLELVTVLFKPPHRDRSEALRGDLAKLGELSATVDA
jgi:hypothetical protein